MGLPQLNTKVGKILAHSIPNAVTDVVAERREVLPRHALAAAALSLLELSEVAAIALLQPVRAGGDMCVRVCAAIGKAVCAEATLAAVTL